MSDALATPPLKEQWDTVQQILTQDLEPDPDQGGFRIRQGVSKERRISIRDGEMRHGRKSKSSRFDGFKRHLGLDLDAGLIVAAAITAGNRPEGEAAADLVMRLSRQQGFSVEDCHIDRGYLAADAIAERRRAGMRVHCKAFPLRNFGRFTKADFTLDFDAQRITCPAGTSVPLVPGAVARFPVGHLPAVLLRPQCTVAPQRSVSIHPHEPFLVELRARQRTVEGRAQLRKRIPVEHGLAHLGASQGKRARYLGVRKNLFDLRRR